MNDKAIVRGNMAPMTEHRALALINRAWPGAPDDVKLEAAALCYQYNLNPFLKHIVVLKFESKKEHGKITYEVYPTILATRAIAQHLEYKYSYVDGPRLMTEEEQQSIYGNTDKTVFRSITILKDSDGNLYPGYGSWPKEKTVLGADNGNTPQNMSHIHSERAAFDRMCPGRLPSGPIGDVSFYAENFNIRTAIMQGEKEQNERVQEDIDDLWPKDSDIELKPEVDMLWLKESLAEIKVKDSPTYYRLVTAIKNMVGANKPADWTEAMSLLTREQAKEFVRAVSEAMG